MADDTSDNAGGGSSGDDPNQKPKSGPGIPAVPDAADPALAKANAEKNEDLLRVSDETNESLMLTVSGRLIAQKGDGPYGGGNDGGDGDGGA